MFESKGQIVFYDGDCGFCNRSVAFILKNDKTRSIKFAAIQSDFTNMLFRDKGWPAPDLSTFYFYENAGIFEKSTGALKVAKYLKFPYTLMLAFWIIPPFIRNYVYNVIAKRRRNLSKDYCVMPSIEERKRFIVS